MSFMMSLTTTHGYVNSMTSVFIYPFTGKDGVSVSHGRPHVTDIAQCCFTQRTRFLVARVMKEAVSWLREETVVVDLLHCAQSLVKVALP